MTETATEPEALPSPDVVRLAGITYRQLDYWTARGFLKPGRAGRPTDPLRNLPGSGYPRSWPAAEVQVACLMSRLIGAGLPISTAASIARSGEARYEIAPGIVIEVAP